MSSDLDAGDPVFTFRANRDCYLAINKGFSRPFTYSDSIGRLFYSIDFRGVTRARVSSGSLEHPKRRHSVELSPDGLKSLYAGSSAMLLIPEGPIENPPIHTIKILKGHKDLQYLDMGGALFTKPDPFRHFNRFSALRCLSLRNCGLLAVPQDLESLPKPLRFLDLSMNFLSQLPQNTNWNHLKGLNLSENSFSAWPPQVVPDEIPKLSHLSLAGNAIGNPPPSQTGFRRLRYLDLSYTLITCVPPWIGECSQLRMLFLAGATKMGPLPPELLLVFKSLQLVDVSGMGLGLGDVWVPPGLALLVMKGWGNARRAE